ncbi:TIGR03089 family protein [Tenggerimyces flavus]|uniref:TIGR03089 family protein n=1 Tax=Tenggerimyces flavus TaxID=1708749 RepID=A0ABV7Y5K4_9ACTN|nr:TIGR03089 family protein [Tenggerimyces flavus]MBM7790716.1 uncharacterized protein (TIGR03089 family) [Tenggerimyces flavus]
MTPAQLLAAARTADPASPFLTFYNDATDERIELSLTSFDNWVAKTANLLQDGLGTEPGERVAILLPPHWQGAVWMLAAWSAGLIVDLSGNGAPDVVVTGPDTLDEAVAMKARDTLALALRPLGGRFTTPLPAGVLDYGAEVPTYGDHFAPYVPVAPSDLALAVDGTELTAADLVARATAVGLDAGARVLTTANPAAKDGYLDALLAPLAVRGSIVLVRNPKPERTDRRVADERVTHP